MRHRLNILVTAGPTQEYIDPVRFITNKATGTLGFSVANEAALRGHKVTLISGLTVLSRPERVREINVVSASDMFKAVKDNFRDADCLIMTAAVSDFTPVKMHLKKIKRDKKELVVRLERTKDILSSLPEAKDKIVVGFSLETEKWVENSLKKLKNKKLDLIVGNKLDKRSDPFGLSHPEVVFIDTSGRKEFVRGRDKAEIASLILDKVEEMAGASHED